nr:hypothetical protein CFP56_40318 [Quercus suber]
MTETRSVAALTDKFNVLSKSVDQHEAEFNTIHQKLDAVTIMLQSLSETVQGITEAGSGWHQRQQQRPNSPMGHTSPLILRGATTMASVVDTEEEDGPHKAIWCRLELSRN